MPFQPGQSGNPAGRRREDSALREMARAHTEDAIRALVEALKNEKTSVPAAVALLDRGWGKPVQAIAGADGESPLQIMVVTGIDRSETGIDGSE